MDQAWADDDDSTMVALAKDMVSCWPNSTADIARSIGTTARDLGNRCAIPTFPPSRRRRETKTKPDISFATKNRTFALAKNMPKHFP